MRGTSYNSRILTLAPADAAAGGFALAGLGAFSYLSRRLSQRPNVAEQDEGRSRLFSMRRRAALFAAGLIPLGLLIVAIRLTPSPSGLGTHQQLGLAPCWIHQNTGVPCPSCGMTTAWAHAVRGDWTAAAGVNLGGTLAAAAALVVGPWLVVSALLARWFAVQPTSWLLVASGSLWLTVTALDWAWRIWGL